MKRKILGAAGLLALAGCANPHMLQPHTSVPARFEAKLPDSGAPVAIAHWWDTFADPQLKELIEQSLASAPDERTALAQLREAQAIRHQALTAYDPQGNLSASVSSAHTNLYGVPAAERPYIITQPSDPTLNTGFTVSWEADLLGRRNAARASANADLAAARYDFYATRLSLAANVASALFQARGIAAQIEEARATLRIASELAKLGHLRVESGIGSQVDAARLDTAVASARSDLTNLEAQLNVARRQLLVLIGRGNEPLASLPVAPTLPVPPRPPALTPGEVMQQRPDVLAAEAGVRSAAGKLKLDKLALFPRLALQPGATYTLITGPAGYATSIWTLAAGLTVPILDRKRLLAEMDAQSARADMAVIAYEKAVQTAYGEAENSLTILTADLTRLDQLTLAEEQARFAFSAQEKGYRAGIIDLDSLLQTERTWRDSRIALVVLKTSALTDAVNSFKALGGGWSPDEQISGDRR